MEETFPCKIAAKSDEWFSSQSHFYIKKYENSSRGQMSPKFNHSVHHKHIQSDLGYIITSHHMEKTDAGLVASESEN